MDYAIIVAGGKGLRMGADVPKQFLSLGGLPVLMRTIECFRQYSSALQLVLVLPAEQQMYWQQLCCEHRFEVPCQLVEGGPTRFHSVKNALATIPPSETGFVAVHDGVRPFPSLQVIRRCFDVVREAKAVVPVTEVVETLRRIEADGTSTTVPREFYRSVQTSVTSPRLRAALSSLLHRRCLGGGIVRPSHHARGRKPRKHQNHHPPRPQSGGRNSERVDTLTNGRIERGISLSTYRLMS